MPVATLTSKGQTTIPREVREFLKLKPGDRLDFKVNRDGKTVTLTAANIHVSSLKGILKHEGMKPHNPDERKVAFQKRAPRK